MSKVLKKENDGHIFYNYRSDHNYLNNNENEVYILSQSISIYYTVFFINYDFC